MNEVHIPQLVAHRGLMATFPENSWPALKTALQAGACWLEFDVQMCRDGSFVVLHDDNLARTGGIPASIFEVTGPELQQLSVHEPGRFGERFFPLAPVTLEQVLQRLDDYPRTRVMVEIKEESLQHWGLDRVMKKLAACLHNYSEQCVLISFSAEAVVWTQANSRLQSGWVLHRYDPAHLQHAGEIQPSFLICNHTKVPAGESPGSGNWQWMLYDITDPGLALQWATRGVELIETGNIAAMLRHPLLARRCCR